MVFLLYFFFFGYYYYYFIFVNIEFPQQIKHLDNVDVCLLYVRLQSSRDIGTRVIINLLKLGQIGSISPIFFYKIG